MEYKDYYKTLEVSREATADEIQKSYRRLARKFHPDISREANAEARFKEIAEAYEVLKDPEKRQRYDQYGQAWKARASGAAPPHGFEGFGFDFGGQPGSPFGSAPSGFSSFFEMLFGQGAGGGPAWGAWKGEGRGGWARPGANQEVTLRLRLEEAARGGVREIALLQPNGETRRVRVNLPRGVRPGQTVRVPGRGEGGRGGGPAGDLLLQIELLPHPDFRLEGRNLVTVLEIAPWEAALGGEASVPTLDGQVRIRIPAGTSSGRRIRVRGHGFPPGKSGEPGDLLAEVRIVVPEKLSAKERELFEKLRDGSGFRPRD